MASTFLRQFWYVDPALVSKRTAFRDALAVALALSLGLVVATPQIAVVMGIGAVGTAMADGPEAVRLRVVRLLLAASFMALSAFAGAYVGEWTWAVVLVAALWGVGGGIVVALGPEATTIGINAIVVFVVMAHTPLDPLRALGVAGLVFGGGLIALLVAAIAVPSRVTPQRRAIAAAYEHLAELARGPHDPHTVLTVSAPIAIAKRLLFAFGTHQTPRASALRTLLDQAERIRVAIVSLGAWGRDERERDPAVARTVDAALREIADALADLAATLLRAKPVHSADAATDALATYRTRLERHDAVDPLPAAIARTLDAVAGQLRAAELAVGTLADDGDFFRDVRGVVRLPVPPVRAAFATLRANLTLQSTVARHALRLAACLAIAEFIVRTVGPERGYWLPMTAALVLRPDFSETFSRGVTRIAGTLLGIAIAFGVDRFAAGQDVGRVALIFIAVFFARSVGRSNYALLTTAITVYVVELLALVGEPVDVTSGERTLNTLLGGALALALYVAWPTWERARVGAVLAALMDAYRAYWAVLAEHLVRDAPSHDERLDDLRLAARLARSNAEASLSRARAEPNRSASEVDAYGGVLAGGHRFVLSGLRLESGGVSFERLDGATERFFAETDATLRAIASTLRGAALPADLPDLRATQRALAAESTDDGTRFFALEADNVANSLNTVVALLRRDARAHAVRVRARNIRRLRSRARAR